MPGVKSPLIWEGHLPTFLALDYQGSLSGVALWSEATLTSLRHCAIEQWQSNWAQQGKEHVPNSKPILVLSCLLGWNGIALLIRFCRQSMNGWAGKWSSYLVTPSMFTGKKGYAQFQCPVKEHTSNWRLCTESSIQCFLISQPYLWKISFCPLYITQSRPRQHPLPDALLWAKPPPRGLHITLPPQWSAGRCFMLSEIPSGKPRDVGTESKAQKFLMAKVRGYLPSLWQM